MRIILIFLYLASVISLNSCAPGLGKTLKITKYPDPISPANSLSFIKVRVLPFIDDRKSHEIGEISGRKLSSEGTVSYVVRRMFEEEIKSGGGSLVEFSDKSVSGAIKNWRIEVTPGFPSSVTEATAEVELTISSQDQGTLYRGRYSGFSSMRNPFLSEAKIEEVLGQAMRFAVYEAFKDRKFLGRLN